MYEMSIEHLNREVLKKKPTMMGDFKETPEATGRAPNAQSWHNSYNKIKCWIIIPSAKEIFISIY